MLFPFVGILLSPYFLRINVLEVSFDSIDADVELLCNLDHSVAEAFELPDFRFTS